MNMKFESLKLNERSLRKYFCCGTLAYIPHCFMHCEVDFFRWVKVLARIIIIYQNR